MKWSKYITGCYRTKKNKFLYLPKKIGKTTKWLEVASWEEQYNGEQWIAIKWLWWL